MAGHIDQGGRFLYKPESGQHDRTGPARESYHAAVMVRVGTDVKQLNAGTRHDSRDLPYFILVAPFA